MKRNYLTEIGELKREYDRLVAEQSEAEYEISRAEVPEMVFHSNAIENSTLTLEDTEDIILRDLARKDASVREIYEAKNLANVTEVLIANPRQKLTVPLILQLHRMLLSGINDGWAGRFRSGREWVRVGNHIGAAPDFTNGLVYELVEQYHNDKRDFLQKIAYFHVEFENIHPFCDGNGRMGRVLINQQLMALGYPQVIIQSKNKHKDYYPIFREYVQEGKTTGAEKVIALALLESLHKRIAMLEGARLVPLKDWAAARGMSAAVAANKAKRQTLPAFRIRGKWMIGEG